MREGDKTGFEAIESTLSLYEIRENSSSEQWRERSEAVDFSSWWRSTSRRSVVQSVSSTLRIKRREEGKELWMNFDEMVEDVESSIESFFVDGRIVLKTREIADKHLGKVFGDLGNRREQQLPLCRSDSRPHLLCPLGWFRRLLGRLLEEIGREKRIQQFDDVCRYHDVIVDEQIR